MEMQVTTTDFCGASAYFYGAAGEVVSKIGG